MNLVSRGVLLDLILGILFSGLGCALCAPLWAQGRAARFDHLTTQDGLTHNIVHCIAQDPRGFIWIGTGSGLSRFDGYHVRSYYHDSANVNTLTSSEVRSLYVDRAGTLWVGTNRGLNQYIADYDRFERTWITDSASQEYQSITTILETRTEEMWVGTYGNGLFRRSKGGRFSQSKHDAADLDSLSSDGVLRLFEDEQGLIWVGTYDGLNLYHNSERRFEYFGEKNGLAPGPIMGICQDAHGTLWVASYYGLASWQPRERKFAKRAIQVPVFRNIIASSDDSLLIASDGLYNFNPTNNELSHFSKNLQDPYSLSHDTVISLFVDRDGVAWAGSDGGGVDTFDTRQLNFRNYLQSGASAGLNDRAVSAVRQDSRGNVWAGTESGLNRIDRKRDLVTRVDLEGKDERSYVLSLLEDHNGALWVGTVRGLVKLEPDQRKTTYRSTTPPPWNISYDSVLSLHEDRVGRIWIGTQGGLDVYTPGQPGFRHYSRNSEPLKLTSDQINSIADGVDGTIWVGTTIGLNALDLVHGRARHYLRDESVVNSLSNSCVNHILVAHDGTLWVATNDGLNHLDNERQQFQEFRNRDGLASNFICGILEDDQGMLWISTDKGLSRLDPVTKAIRNYDVHDGLQGNIFNLGVAYRSPRGELFFGGTNGLTSFFPKDLQRDLDKPMIQVTNFAVFDEIMAPRYIDPKSPLEKVVEATDEITLSYKQNMIQFDFAVMHYGNPRKNRFKFKLEGQDAQWVLRDASNPSASYTNLDPGTYKFRVIGAHYHDVWNSDGRTITIKINSPPWLTWYAYLIYALTLVLIVWAYIRAQNRKLAMERAINERQREVNIQQHEVNERLRKLDRFKDEILANTSHELRTPLNGIIGLADSLRDGSAGSLTEPARRDLATIVSCGKRLSSLINDILDYSRLKNSDLRLNRSSVDLHLVADMVLKLSKPLLGLKDIKLIEAIPKDLPTVQADENRLMQILHNLVGNAIKFTEKGHVKISANLMGDKVQVNVSDTGVGIPEEKFDQIFEAFEQGDASAVRSFGGTGLGLAITRRLVNLHGGEIRVNSVIGTGTTFSFSLPVSGQPVGEMPIPRSGQGDDVFSLEEEIPTLSGAEAAIADVAHQGSGTILVVDDEPVNRKVLLNYLSPHGYRLLEASGGQEALRLVSQDASIDLVLLDIMMPRMSGYEVCTRIREMRSVNELPVIFLSAKNQTSDLLEGFVVGGNDYLAKPITKAELLARVKTHLELLDVNRNLEHKVQERTRELETKNQKILEQQEELIRKQRQLVIQEKMASLGTLTAGIAHEINNPVNFAYGSVQNLVVDLERFREFFFDLAGPDADEEIVEAFREKMDPLFEHSETIIEGTRRISGIVKELQTFSRMDEADIKHVSLVDGLESTISLVKSSFAASVTFVCRFDDPLEIECWPAEMNQVFMNLIINGCQAIVEKQRSNGLKAGETLTITTFKEDGCAVVRFQDEGCGMTPEVRGRIFDPFFTTKPVGEGSGLGLSISYEVVKKHKGRIEVTSHVGVGTTMTIFLPLDVTLSK